MNVAFKIRVFCDQLRFFNNVFVTSYLHGSALMKSQCTEAASAETSPIADQRKFDFRYGRHAAILLIGRMIGSHIGKAIYLVHLLC